MIQFKEYFPLKTMAPWDPEFIRTRKSIDEGTQLVLKCTVYKLYPCQLLLGKPSERGSLNCIVNHFVLSQLGTHLWDHGQV